MRVGLFFGSFNPIHIGHLLIANYMVEFTNIDQCWFVVSPHNPLKNKKSLLASHHRYDMAAMAIEGDDRFQVSDIEFRMPKPSYTIDTLTYLKERYPKYSFVLIMGEDNLDSIEKWKNYELLLNENYIYYYPRNKETKFTQKKYNNVKMVSAPLVEISSSFIRKAISENRDVRYFLPSAVYDYIKKMHFYEDNKL